MSEASWSSPVTRLKVSAEVDWTVVEIVDVLSHSNG